MTPLTVAATRPRRFVGIGALLTQGVTTLAIGEGTPSAAPGASGLKGRASAPQPTRLVTARPLRATINRFRMVDLLIRVAGGSRGLPSPSYGIAPWGRKPGHRLDQGG